MSKIVASENAEWLVTLKKKSWQQWLASKKSQALYTSNVFSKSSL